MSERQIDTSTAQRGKPGFTSAEPSEQEILAELNRVVESPLFAQSDRLGRFLRFTADYALSGQGDSLKEYLIGVSVYDRKPPYHPSQDSIVRTEARRLRAKLKEYYETEGKNSAVFIYYRPGNYAPLFRRSASSGNSSKLEQASTENELLISGTGVSLAVLPFVDLSKHPLSSQCAQGLTDELIHALTQTDGLKVASPAAVEHMTSIPWDIGSLTSKLNVLNAIEGTVRLEDGHLRIGIRVINPDGFQSSSHRFETLADTKVIADVQEQIVSAFISRSRPVQSLIRKRKATAGGLTLAVYPLVIHAENMLNEGSSADIQPAMLKFQEAIEMAPLFARSYCGLAQCHIELALRGATPSSELVNRAIVAATKAVDLDSEMFGCYSALATANVLSWKWNEAEALYARATELGTHAPSSQQYALYLALAGRFEEGAEQLSIAQRIDPFSYRQKVACAKFLHLTWRFEELLDSRTKQDRYGNIPLECKILMALSAAHLRLRDRALSIVKEIQAESQPQSLVLTAIAEILALVDEENRATKIVNDYRLLAPDARISSYRRSLLALALGRKDECISLLECAQRNREAEMIWLRIDPRFATIRSSKQFKGLVTKVFPKG